jgi:hypothetical protein
MKDNVYIPHIPVDLQKLGDRIVNARGLVELECHLDLFAQGSFITLMMEAVRTSETSVNIYLTTRRYIAEDSKLHTRRRDNLKSHILHFSSADTQFKSTPRSVCHHHIIRDSLQSLQA